MSQIMVYVPYNSLANDLYLHNYGQELCMPNHFYGPAIREYYLLHYIKKGKGVFKIGNETYTITEGQGFLISPNVITYYEADKYDPWEYYWIGFNGSKAESYMNKTCLSVNNPILTNEHDGTFPILFNNLIIQTTLDRAKEITIIGHLYLILGKLLDTYPKHEKKSMKNIGSINSLARKEEYINK